MAVLPDFVAMEAYKGETLKTIFKSMEVLTNFPNQVLILKGSSKVCGLSGRRKGLQRRLIDEVQTLGFPEYALTLRLAELGNLDIQKQILELGKYANEHLEKILADAPNIRDAISDLGKQYTKEERAALRTRSMYTPEMTDKLVQIVMKMAAIIFRDIPQVRKIPSYTELPNTFIFRATLAFYLHGIKQFSHGGLEGMDPKKLRNDFIDMMLVAYSTFFDGIMSADRNLSYIFTEACLLLSELFDAEIPYLARIR